MTGTAEIKVDPDQIFISILLQENLDKDKKTITQQEQDLIKALQAVGIAKEKLVVTDANAYYGKSGFMTKDVVNRKKFELEETNDTQARKAFEQLDLLHIKTAYIARVDHSQINEYKKQAKIKAIKAAKEKATYLLEAIGQQLGGALIVRENSFGVYGNRVSNVMTKSIMSYNADSDGYNENKDKLNLDFKQITVSASIYTKWSILQ